MINNTVPVGRLTKTWNYVIPDQTWLSYVYLAINRTFKNENGDRETDLLIALCGDNKLKILLTGLKRSIDWNYWAHSDTKLR